MPAKCSHTVDAEASGIKAPMEEAGVAHLGQESVWFYEQSRTEQEAKIYVRCKVNKSNFNTGLTW